MSVLALSILKTWQVIDSIVSVPIYTPQEYKYRFSGMIKAKKIDTDTLDWNFINEELRLTIVKSGFEVLLF